MSNPQYHAPSLGVYLGLLFILVNFRILGIHNPLLVRTGGLSVSLTFGGPCRSCFSGAGSCSLFIHFFADLLRGLDQILSRVADGIEVAALHRFAGRRNLVLDLFSFIFGDLIAMFRQEFLDAVDAVVGLVADLHQFTLLLVLGGVSLRVFDHFIDVVLVQPAGSGDADRLFLLCRQIFGGHMYDPVGIDIEAYLDLWHTPWRGGNADQVKMSERLVVRGHFALPLEHIDGHRGLTVRGG